LETAQSHIAFRVGLLRKKYDLGLTEQRVAFTREAAALLSTLSSAIETDAYVSEVAGQTGIAADAIRAEIAKDRASQSPGAAPVRPLQSMGRLSRRDEKGLQSARKGLIQLLFSHPAACRAVEHNGVLKPDEMGDNFYERLLSAALENARANRLVAPADAINIFTSMEEQQLATRIFFQPPVYETDGDAEKALNEMIAVIKRGRYDQLIAEAKMGGEGSLNAVNTLVEAKRNLNALYITLSDG
jgi:DNA primase